MYAIVTLEACIKLGLSNESSNMILQVIELMYEDVEDIEDAIDSEDIVDTVVKINNVISGKVLKYKEHYYEPIHGIYAPSYTITKHSNDQLLVKVVGKNKFGDKMNKKHIITPQDLDYLEELSEEN